MHEENHGHCIPVVTNKVETKEWRKRPKIRINKSQGHSYVQVRNVFGSWVTMGELTSESFAMAWALANSIEGEFLQKRIHQTLERHGLDYLKEEFDKAITDARNNMEYKVSTSSPWNVKEDGPNEEETVFGKAFKKNEETIQKFMAKNGAKSKRAMRKLKKALTIPEPPEIKAEDFPKGLVDQAIKQRRKIVYEWDGKKFKNFRLGGSIEKKENEKEKE